MKKRAGSGKKDVNAASIVISVCFILAVSFIPLRVCSMDIQRLEGDLQVVFEQRPGTGVVAAQVWVKVGSKYEDPKVAGITHFIEHLIFKGTEKLRGNAFASRVEAIGGVVNAFTSYDNTVYHIIVPKASFQEGFDLLLESVKNPAFPAEEMEKERQVILEEIKMGEDDTQRKLFKELFSASYQGHPYGRPVIGFTETVKSMTRGDILGYYKEHYRPDNMTIVLTGDFDKETAKEAIQRYFPGEAGVVRKPVEGAAIPPPAKSDRGPRIIEKELREDYLALSYPIPRITDRDIPALEVLGTMLGDGESSRLIDVLKRRKGLVNSIATYLFSPREEGLFVIYASFRGKDYEDVMTDIRTQVAGIETVPPSEWEMGKAKNMLKAFYVYAQETVQGKARQIGDFLTLTGNPGFLDSFLEAIDGVTVSDIKRVYEKYLAHTQPAVVYMKAKKSASDNPYTLNLPNGMRCVVNRNKASRSFDFRVGFIGGLKEEDPGKNGLFNVLSRTLLKGTKKKDALSISGEIDFLAGDMSPYSGRNIFGLSGKFLSKDAKAALTLLKEVLADTDPTGQELARTKQEVLSSIRRRDDDPVSYTFVRFNEALYKNHPYEKDVSGDEKDVEGLSLEGLKDAYRKFVTPSNAVLAVSGDVDEKEIFGLVKELFSGWTGEDRHISARKVNVVPCRKAVEKDIIQTHMVFGFSGPGLIDEDRYAVEVMASILSGMGGRMFKVLREENPYAYSVTFFNQAAYEVSGIGIYIGTDAKYVPSVEKLARVEIEKIIKEGFTAEEVENGKKRLVGNHFIRMQANSAIATNMCFDAIYGLKPNEFKLYPGHIEKITRQDVNRAAAKYLSLEKMVLVTVGRGQHH